MNGLDIDAPPSHLRELDGTDVPLDEHLADVAKRILEFVPEGATTADGSAVADVGQRIAWIHDIGKLTTWFQEHLHADDDNSDIDGPSHHAPLGALVAYYTLDTAGFEDDVPLVGFLAVARHHGQLPDTADYVRKATVERDEGPLRRLFREDIFEQVANIDTNESTVADTLIDRSTDGEGSWKGFCEWLHEIHQQDRFTPIGKHVLGGRKLSFKEPEQLSEEFYDGVLQIWSALVLADKTSARHLTSEVDLPSEKVYGSPTPRRTAIDAKVRSLQRDAERSGVDDRTRSLNEKRERARQEVRSRAETFAESGDSVATLTLPTGFGKTLTGLDAGLTVLDRKPGTGRLVYALPFTSIIDQVAAESESLFDVDCADSGLLTVDHHLSETRVPLPDSPEEVPDDSRADAESILGESWRSGMVVTTFVQLFESLAGPGNVQSMKLPSLYDSVVVLDEPQALPHRWWALVERLARLLVEEYDVTVIAMTATQPKLFTGSENDETAELVPDPGRYYEGLDRVRFELHPSVEAALDSEPDPIDYDGAGERLAAVANEGASVLSICNTIDSARELTQSVEQHANPLVINDVYDHVLANEGGKPDDMSPETTVERAVTGWSGDRPLLVHLTTRHRPVDRQHLIDVAIELTERDLPVVFVSTQLVEAGVDVSFDRVFRDFAPLDSIVQAAGRCNRSFNRDTGLVTTWVLEPPEGRERTPSTAVYDHGGDSLTKISALSLVEVYDGEPIDEYTVTRTAVESYFAKLDKRGVGDPEYLEYIERADAETLGRLSLIDEQPAVEVIVTRTDAEAEHVEELRDAYREYDWETVEAKTELLKPLQVSVPMYGRDDEELFAHCGRVYGEDGRPHDEDGRLYIDARQARFDDYFDTTEGVVTPDDSVEARLL
ncbi:CRISPR-associated endonuclease Cas3'' [Halalkaliarchaeum sp. AArc-GB]|uniref:CRISPR-associated endonuclease Cas3'' n=1 Tax=Halalkaliarchaeum sp. AArc-GB TaxID=3074078 RepID=UPI00286219D7|nr:CRISPR-associated endonuclease Cas3'' [Halalkaliarchaeum sp. AArc-GB]MDR5674489.1 CRISPR-associated endonuclease Cas3'' [Halalkaliarchaeum sp. AArc-GB]